MEEVLRFFNARLALENAIAEGELFVKKGKIVAPQPIVSQSIDVKGKLISPGFIDLQVNGGFGFDFSSQPGSKSVVAKKLPATGVTSFLATIVSLPLESYEKVLDTLALSNKGEGANCLGFHLEGPHLQAEYKGAHNEAFQKPTPLDFWKQITARFPIKIVTLAPELPGSLELIRYLHESDIIASFGHTDATYTQLQAAKQAGLGMATHLFNAMRPFHHREAGPIGFVLGDKSVPYSLIADGKHVSETACRLAWNVFPEGLILVTDSSAALGMQAGHFVLGGKKIEIRDNAVYLPGSDVLAGSMCPMNQMVLHFKNAVQCTLEEALACATSKPAKLLGLEGQKGSLAVGADADFLILDPETLEVNVSFVAGNLAYSAIDIKK